MPDHHRALHDDDQLLFQLARSLDERDLVPEDALAAARSAAQLGRADDALAELVFDSLVPGTGVPMRGSALVEARSLGFVAGGHQLDVELLNEGGVVLGQLDPADAARIDLETESGSTTVTADDLGRFRFTGARGPLRLRIFTASGQVVLTPWITW